MSRGFQQLRIAMLVLAGLAVLLLALQAYAAPENPAGDTAPGNQIGDIVAQGRRVGGACVFDSAWGAVGGRVEEGKTHTVRVEINDKCQAVVTEVSSSDLDFSDIPWRNDETPDIVP